MKVFIPLFIIFALVFAFANAGVIYPDAMEIIAIHQNIVYLETATGNIFTMAGAEDYQVGDIVSVIMFTNGTDETVRDDEIIRAVYSGYNIKEVQ